MFLHSETLFVYQVRDLIHFPLLNLMAVKIEYLPTIFIFI